MQVPDQKEWEAIRQQYMELEARAEQWRRWWKSMPPVSDDPIAPPMEPSPSGGLGGLNRLEAVMVVLGEGPSTIEKIAKYLERCDYLTNERSKNKASVRNALHRAKAAGRVRTIGKTADHRGIWEAIPAETAEDGG